MRDPSIDLIPALGACLAAVAAVAAVFTGILWLIRDARSRGKSGCLVCLLVFFLPIPGLLIWLVFRPERIPDSDFDVESDFDDE